MSLLLDKLKEIRDIADDHNEPEDDDYARIYDRVDDLIMLHNKGELVEKIMGGAKPDPFKFKIIRSEVSHNSTIILAEYEGCATYNGHKLMLLRGVHTDRQTLDPHFLEGHPVVARFAPTKVGYTMAVVCSTLLDTCARMGQDIDALIEH